ncbi:DDE-type integrase/transposase/recombinase, partial [Nocardia sp. NPDC023852]|uniref:DDE-type integrase/transposase/recombinase n=1 Tax=Nocardia sp. NPDC023852 TaxID=3154697 RepID=UPI0033C2024D
GIRVGRKRVERLMRSAGLQGAFLRRRWRVPSTRQNPRATPAPDLVERDFTAAEPNRLWVADATRIPTGQGVFWLAAVRDAFSNRIVGWKTSDRCDTDLVLGALEYAVWLRDIRDGELIHHSDTATRIGEVSGCRVGDIDTDQWIWTLRRQTTPGPGGMKDKRTKGKRSRPIPVIEEIRPIVLRRINAAAVRVSADPALGGCDRGRTE